MIIEYTKKACNEMGFEITDGQLEKLEVYYELLIEWNKKLNLTRITEPEEVAIKHFEDSLSLLKYYDIPQGATLIDVGTGAGFPGIPIKIVRPDVKVTLLDSLNKRLVFLKDVCEKIDIDVNLVHSRAEIGGINPLYREKFDVAVSRAVARLNILSEYCLPYVKIGGAFVAMKGPDMQEEIAEGKKAVSILGGKEPQVNEFCLSDGSKRTIVVVEKEKDTLNKYPRQGVKIKNKPL